MIDWTVKGILETSGFSKEYPNLTKVMFESDYVTSPDTLEDFFGNLDNFDVIFACCKEFDTINKVLAEMDELHLVLSGIETSALQAAGLVFLAKAMKLMERKLKEDRESVTLGELDYFGQKAKLYI